MYAIVDLETTGIASEREKITEICIIQHDGTKVTNRWSTFINPERPIAHNITQLTGISNFMIREAPRFFEVAKKVLEQLDGRTLVAHNARFNYSFLQAEFKQFGFSFQAKTLCTFQLSRMKLPGHKSYSLGQLCKELGIELQNRHRAEGGALTTVKLFEFLLKGNNQQPFDLVGDFLLRKNLHPHLDMDLIKALPNSCGVYYIKDEKDVVVYIGKSKNIRNRIITHLNNTQTKRSITMAGEMVSVGFEETGSELIALLKESHEIKVAKPKFNRAQRNTGGHFGIFCKMNQEGYLTLEARRIKEDEIPIVSYSAIKEAKEYLTNFCAEYHLCQKLCGLYKTESACFHYQIKECDGACTGEISPEMYNKRIEAFKKRFALHEDSMAILEEGRNESEYGVVWIEHGSYYGYGFINKSETTSTVLDLKPLLTPYPDNRDVQRILRGYLRKNSPKTIAF